MLCNLIKKFSKAQSGSCRNRDRIPDSQIIELIYIIPKLLEAVHLVDSKDDGLFGFPKHVSDLRIRVHKSLTDIHDKDDNICGGNGNLRLLPHLGQNDVAAVRFNTSCINQGKIHIQPGTVCIDPVPGNAWCVLYNRNGITG